MTMTDTASESIASPDEPVSPFRRPWVVAAAIVGLALVLGALAFKILEPIQVLPRIRLAPGFVLQDQHGDAVTSEDLRGSIVLYTFTYTGCEEPCIAPEPTMREIKQRLGEVDLGGTDFRMVTVSFDPERDGPAELTARAEAMGADGDQWVYATADEALVKTVVGTGFKTWFEERDNGEFLFDPALVLVDGWGVVRGEYRYATLASDADRILRHVDILGEEVRNSHGAASLAYEAAHYFLCYP